MRQRGILCIIIPRLSDMPLSFIIESCGRDDRDDANYHLCSRASKGSPTDSHRRRFEESRRTPTTHHRGGKVRHLKVTMRRQTLLCLIMLINRRMQRCLIGLIQVMIMMFP